ncbi:MAG: C-terminal helicase domain-containing protein [Sulfurihydrogenibium sp.]|uniref:C-terminal helicase domain-containing protein n=1 Tax=Sulfurihydrogenibium sp. TaxID=2053621 RepID=UPI003D1292A8
MLKKSQFLGFTYEGAFKLGFLEKYINDYQSFKDGFFKKLKDEFLLDFNDENLNKAWTLLQKNVPFDMQNIPQELTELGKAITFDKITMFIFLNGFYQGKFFAKNLSNVEIIKYEMGEETSIAGHYANADLIFKDNETLYVVDFKLAGAESKTMEIFGRSKDEPPKIPFRVYGLPVNVSIGESNFANFVKSLLNIKDKLLEIQKASPEIKGWLQILSYAVDYLSDKKRDDIREINLSLLYPLSEPFSARFYYSGEDLSSYQQPLKDLYAEVKKLDWEYEEATEDSELRRRRLKKEIPEKIKEIKSIMSKKEEEVELIKPDSIQQSREHVRKSIEEFFENKEPVKVLALLHSAGSGKTSQLRQKILSLKGKHIVFYMATRRVLVDREKTKIEEEKIKNNINLEVVYGKKDINSFKKVKNVGDSYQEVGKGKGILKKVCEDVSRLAGKHDFIWAVLTQQTLLEHKNIKGNSKTSNHIKDILSTRLLKNYTFHFILDEFLGYSNGFLAIMELLDVLKTIKEQGGKANLYIFDANAYSPTILSKLLKEYKEYNVIPTAMVLCDYKEKEVFQEDGINFYCYGKHGYPSPEIRVRRKFLNLNNSMYLNNGLNEFSDRISDYIKETFTDKDKSTALVFVQHKEIISFVKSSLENKGFSCMVATADSKKSQDAINKGKEDVILATSAVSRGIDLSRPEKPVNHIYLVILDWGIEGNLVELIQAISRARGDEKTEQMPKNIHLIYIIEPLENYTLDNILEYIPEDVREKNRDLVKLLLEKSFLEEKLELDFVVSTIVNRFLKTQEGETLVPIPKQYKTKFMENTISDMESAINFLDSIYTMEQNDDLFKLIKYIEKSWTLKVTDLNFDSFEYYHPYLLFESQRIKIFFDSSYRRKIKENLEKVADILKKHNEEKTEEIERLINEKLLPDKEHRLPVLIPVYSLVITKHFLKKEDKVAFKITGRIGRGEANTLMGSIGPSTYCQNLENKEYACIPLGEDYPYKEVLSGRFAKFPIEFIKSLLRG